MGTSRLFILRVDDGEALDNQSLCVLREAFLLTSFSTTFNIVFPNKHNNVLHDEARRISFTRLTECGALWHVYVHLLHTEVPAKINNRQSSVLQ